MTEKEQIEEMLKLDIEECAGFYSAFINDMRISKNKPLSVSKTIMSFDCPKEYILQALGIPENAVVLTREEYDELLRQGAMIDFLKDCVKQVRKETAEKIIHYLLKVGNTERLGYLKIYVENIEELIKQYGVEVDE